MSCLRAIANPPSWRALSVLAVTLASALGAVAAPAQADEPAQLVITSPSQGSAIADAAPAFGGLIESTSGEEPQLVLPVTVVVHQGQSVAGAEVQRSETGWFPSPIWAAPSGAPLPDGYYTAQALSVPEEGGSEEALASAPVTFRIDTSAPSPTITGPGAGATVASGPVALAGGAGTAEGDLPAVRIQVYAGGAAEGTPVEGVEVPASGGAWSASLGGLSPGTYTLRAQQYDDAGNLGSSAPVTFSIAPLPPPSAAFQWFPSTPQVGEPVTLISSSTDPGSPISAYAWGTGAAGPLHPGGPSLTTTFATAGPHVMRLAVTDAEGRTSLATHTITVRHRPLALMQPFPIVRIAGSETAAGARLSLLTVTAPVGARVTVRVRGGSRHPGSTSRVASAGRHGGTTLLSFPRFERPMTAGQVLEVRVSKAEEIGKLTRFAPRRHRLPLRSDTCLSPNEKPMACPSR